MAMALMLTCAVTWASDSTGTPPDVTTTSPRPAVRQADNLAIITISGGINAVTSKSVERRIKQAEAQGADAIVIELDTPGGELGAVYEITSALRSTSLYTIAWVHDEAYSGGSIIAVACNEIVTSPAAKFGDSGIIKIGMMGVSGLEPTERAKFLSPLIAELVESARANGYDEVLIQSLAALNVETWQVRDTRTGKDFFLTRGEYKALFGEEPAEGGQAKVGSPALKPLPDAAPFYEDESSPPLDGDTGNIERTPIVPTGTPSQREGESGFVPGAPDFTPDMKRSIAISVQTRSSRPDFTQEEAANYTLIGPATDGTAFLTLQGASIADFGFSRATIANDEELKQYTGAQQVARLNQSWSEHVVVFMTQGTSSFIVRAVLIVVFLLGLFIELSMPGLGVAGFIALIAFGGLVVPPMLINAAAWWTMVAILVGVLLILTEVFIVPGFGIPGVSGLVLLVLGLIGTFAPAGQLFPGQGGSDSSLAWAASIVVLSIFTAGAGAYLVSRYTQHLPIANKLILTTAQKSHATAPTMLGAMSANASASSGAAPIGATGVTLTRLMPSGTAEFDSEVVDVVSEIGFIEAGESIRVVSSTTYRVAVERIDNDAEAPDGGETA